jgi:hypothetical protein
MTLCPSPQFINQFRRHGPIWAFAISWLNLLWWRVGINLVNLLTIYLLFIVLLLNENKFKFFFCIYVQNLSNQ